MADGQTREPSLKYLKVPNQASKSQNYRNLVFKTANTRLIASNRISKEENLEIPQTADTNQVDSFLGSLERSKNLNMRNEKQS